MAIQSRNSPATPLLYLLLAVVAALVQWNRWQALHHTRNLLAFVLALLIFFTSAAYLWRALRARRAAGL